MGESFALVICVWAVHTVYDTYVLQGPSLRLQNAPALLSLPHHVQLADMSRNSLFTSFAFTLSYECTAGLAEPG
jgi:hypothetical protein